MSNIQYKSFRLGDLFDKLPVKKASKQMLRKTPDEEYCVPVVYAKFGDNGIMYWGKKGEFSTYSNVISIVYNGVISAGKVYAQERPTGILAESYFIRLKQPESVPFEANLYMALVIEHVIYPKYTRENLAIWDNRVENEEIKLPVLEEASDCIDFQYMKQFILDLYNKKNDVLNSTLVQLGLEDCSLSDEQIKLYKSHFEDETKFKKFRLEKLFVAETGDVDLQQKDVNGKGEYLVNSGVDNTGIKGRTDRPAKVFPPNTITIDFWGNAYYRDYPYKMATHNHVFSLSGSVIKNRFVGMYLVGQMSKFPLLFSYNNMATWNKLKDVQISLPVKDQEGEEIDFDLMESIIRITEKRIAARLKKMIVVNN